MGITADNLITKGQRYINSVGVRVEAADWYGFFTDAIRKLRRGRTLPWQKRETTLDLFTDVHTYPAPSDFDSFIKPNKNNPPSVEGPFLQYGTEKEFYANQNCKLAVSWNRETKYILARYSGAADLKLEGFNDDADEYTLGGDAASAVQDDVDFREGSASLRFTVTDSTNQSTITRTLADGVDISDYINLGKVFLWVHLPEAITSLVIRYGNSASVYYEIAAVTTQHHGAALQEGWNLISWDMEDAVETGSVDDTDIDYFLVTLNHSGVSGTFRVDGLFFRKATPFRLPYNSNAVVKTNVGAYQESVTAGNDTILGDDTFEDAVFMESLKLAGFFKFRDSDVFQVAQQEYNNAINDLSRRYPSQEAPVQVQWYKKANQF